MASNAPQVSRDRIQFAEQAAEAFRANAECATYTGGPIQQGELFAVRWGLGDDCVLVFTIGDDPTNFVQFVTRAEKQVSIGETT